MACQPNQPGSIVTASRETSGSGKVRRRSGQFRRHYTYLRAFAAGFGPGRCRASVRPGRASSAAMQASKPSGRLLRSPRRIIQGRVARRVNAAEHSRRLRSGFRPKRICQVPMAICCPSPPCSPARVPALNDSGAAARQACPAPGPARLHSVAADRRHWPDRAGQDAFRDADISASLPRHR